ncbi:MAG: TIGR04211 family SH3 domain-containing protein [Gammaproteobacteria bacterium]|nr:TIGR04211 family SH3 domain-containing protein [Gammaproteobacteria bacterium]
MNKHLTIIFVLLFSSVLKAQVQTTENQTIYVIDQIQVGLHTDKTLQSPIIKLIPSGSPLELVKQEAELSFVRDASGTGGWVDTSYISEFSSAEPKIQEAEGRIRSLETSLSNARLGQTSEEIDNLMRQINDQSSRIEQLSSENLSLNQQINASNSDSLYEKIDQLSQENRQLDSQLANILESASQPVDNQSSDTTEGLLTVKNILIFSGIILVVGIGLGIYLMDFANRRRHGGFRI